MAEDHGLGDGDGAVDVTESPELLISVIAQNIILLDGVQGLLLALQLDNVWEHLAPHCPCVPSVPLNADALVLVALGGNHHISLIQHKHLDLLGIYEFQFGTPVQHGAGCADDDLLRDLLIIPSFLFVVVGEFQVRVKVSHLFNHFPCLKCQLVCWGKAQTLKEQKDSE
uniref:Uncharacterized protein n=1 Tax=Zosterops lateralis melanops TaxID=1220523 RepID=A0A8D2QNU2_ZOSLA